MLSLCCAYHKKCLKITYLQMLGAIVDSTHEVECDIDVVW